MDLVTSEIEMHIFDKELNFISNKSSCTGQLKIASQKISTNKAFVPTKNIEGKNIKK